MQAVEDHQPSRVCFVKACQTFVCVCIKSCKSRVWGDTGQLTGACCAVFVCKLDCSAHWDIADKQWQSLVDDVASAQQCLMMWDHGNTGSAACAVTPMDKKVEEKESHTPA